MNEAEAFAPCHITGFFQIFDQSTNALYVGSKGAGIALDMGVSTIVRIRETSRDLLQININGLVSNSADVSRHVVEVFRSRFERLRNFTIFVEHHVDVPIGAGLGTSGAAALGLALALNESFGLGLSKIEAAQLAHVAEVERKTGLGTVIAETSGGLEIRIQPGAPGIGEVKRIPVQKDAVVVCLVFGPLLTKELLADEKIRRRVNELGGRLVDDLAKEPSVGKFLEFSRQFAEHVGLISDRVRAVLRATDNARFVCSMPMFGESVFTITEQESLPELLKILSLYGSDEQIIMSGIDAEGARIIR